MVGRRRYERKRVRPSVMGVLTLANRRDLDVPDCYLHEPGLTTFTGVDELGLEVVGSAWRPAGRCWPAGARRGPVVAGAADATGRTTPWCATGACAVGWRPTVLVVAVRRYRCAHCGHVWRQDVSSGQARSKLSRQGLRVGARGGSCPNLSRWPGSPRGWGGVEHRQRRRPGRGKRPLIDDPARLDGVSAIGVDEHVGATPLRGGKYVTVIIDPDPDP